MIGSAGGSGPGSAGSLWKRAPWWRFSVLCFGLLTLLCMLYPPGFQVRKANAPPPAIDTASYTAPARPAALPKVAVIAEKPAIGHSDATPPAAPRAAASVPAPVRSSPPSPPRTATLSLATPSAEPAKPDPSGIDPALMGRTYHDYVLVNGFKLPLPPGEWAMFANSSVKAIKDPNNTGMNYFLGQIENKRLVAALLIVALRSQGSGFVNFDACANPDNIYSMKEDLQPFGHQSCWIIHSLFTPPWQQWADQATKQSNLIRAAAGDMAAKNVTYPQDLVAVQFYRSESWGLLEGSYLFSPEKSHITSNVAPTFRDADWFGPNLHRFPEKVAYVAKLEEWGNEFWPRFKRAFDEGK